MLHDPQDYLDPDKFDPTRYLPEISGRPAERDPYSIGFGFGRRKCPGIRVADSSLFMACAIIGAAFDIQPVVEHGNVEQLIFEKLPGIISHPKDFKVTIKPRSEVAEMLLRGGSDS
jgi:cytochrome P450